jgi:hypothetical protein
LSHGDTGGPRLLAILQKFGIDIDGAANGAWLRRDYHWTLNNSKRYFDTLNHSLRRANTKHEALQILKELKNFLSKERLPL